MSKGIFIFFGFSKYFSTSMTDVYIKTEVILKGGGWLEVGLTQLVECILEELDFDPQHCINQA